MKIALAGNPNSGKTTTFNVLTGKNEKVGNWAGVTVEKKEHKVKKKYYDGGEEVVAVDLPGAYSMSPFTSEESITSEYVRNENPDAVINIVDATNLSRSLFFTTQLLELGIPMVVALNKSDINEKRHIHIDVKKLSEKLGCPVFDTVSVSADGLGEVVSAAAGLVGKGQKAPYICRDFDKTDKGAAEAADRRRFIFVNRVVDEVEVRDIPTNKKTVQDRIDIILTSRWFGIPIFAIVMFLVFSLSQSTLGPWLADALEVQLQALQNRIGILFEGANPFLYTLLVDGVIGGAIAVIGFLPLVMVMYFLIAVLEDCGYMARVSVVLDPVFKKVGLSGKSVIPFVIGTGCAVPAVMACRTIRDERERRAAVMLTPFMPCGAKLPVISLFTGVFFADRAWVGTLMYFAGIFIVFAGALIINCITGNRTKKSYFIMELPEYKVPSLGRAFKSMCGRGRAYIVKASTIILMCNIAIHIMQSFTPALTAAQTAEQSILALISGPAAYLLVPLIGILSWQLAAAAIAGFIAKENVVGTLAVCFAGLNNFINTENLTLAEGAGGKVATVLALTRAAALAYLMFNLFSPPCFAAIGAMRSEMNSRKWFWGGVAFQLAVGYTVSFFVYQIGTLISTGRFGAGFAGGLAVVTAIIAILVFLCVKGDKKSGDKNIRKLRHLKCEMGGKV